MFSYMRFTKNRSLEDADAIFKQRIADALVIFERHHQDFALRDCPFCGSAGHTAQEPFHDAYGVARCNGCSSLFVNPCPNLAALEDYYSNCECNRMLDAVFKSRHKSKQSFILDARTASVLEIIKKLDKGKPIRILEAGCGSGGALHKLQLGVQHDPDLKDKDIHFAGVDIDSHAVENPVANGLNLTSMPVEQLVDHAAESYDLIIHYELIEHLPDPFTFMCNMKRLLAPGGRIFFSTPNAEGLEMLTGYNGYRLLAHSIFPPMHLNAFSTRNISLFAFRCGLKLKQLSTPGQLDVDMMSICAQHMSDPAFSELAALEDEGKGLLQHLLVRLGASSHMQCVMEK